MDIIELSLERRVQDGEKLLGFTRSLEQRRVELCDQRTEPKNGSQPHGCALFKDRTASGKSTTKCDTELG
jgi:hypothetical protein